jgi:hypothetical protein
MEAPRSLSDLARHGIAACPREECRWDRLEATAVPALTSETALHPESPPFLTPVRICTRRTPADGSLAHREQRLGKPEDRGRPHLTSRREDT